ncbi:DNA-packaging protein [Acetobacter ghanensis]|uniref:DNA-packaging protein n=1 Tax=Acetobacter ghanensis TaxID=431306 RepID=UPI003D333EB7
MDPVIDKESLATRLASLGPDERRKILGSLSTIELEAIRYVWPFWARPDQLPPAGDWFVWLLLGGRGSGKTRSAAEWVRGEIESGRRKSMAIIGPTANALRRVQIEGSGSGMLAISSPGHMPSYEPSTQRLVYPSGAICYLFSAEEPERLRGANLDGAWCDEIVAWDRTEYTWDMLQFALRLKGPLGDDPRIVCSTTPKPLSLIRELAKAPTTAITRSRTLDNAANLSPKALSALVTKYDGTTMGRQELDGELLEDMEGSLWTREMIDALRVWPEGRRFRRIVVAIDPAGSSHDKSDETGIVVVGLGYDGQGYVLEDLSGRYSPAGWARMAVLAYRKHQADRIVAERNFGGEMVEATIRAEARNVPVKTVNASRGKLVRAEPVMALYEQGRVHHVGAYPELEDQMCQWRPGYGKSPDRVDALVWGVTELLIEPHVGSARYVPKPKDFSFGR